MKVADSVRELERLFERERARAEEAEGRVRVYEARDRGAEIAKTVVQDGKWRIHWKNGDEEPVEFSFSPGMWLLGMAQTFLRHPTAFELRVTPESPASTAPSPETKEQGQ